MQALGGGTPMVASLHVGCCRRTRFSIPIVGIFLNIVIRFYISKLAPAINALFIFIIYFFPILTNLFSRNTTTYIDDTRRSRSLAETCLGDFSGWSDRHEWHFCRGAGPLVLSRGHIFVYNNYYKICINTK